MKQDETRYLIRELMEKNKKEVQETINKGHSGGEYYPTKFARKLNSYQYRKYKATCRDIVRKLILVDKEQYNAFFMKNENVSTVEKTAIPKATLNQDLEIFFDALNCLSERDKILAFEKACLNKNVNEIMQEYGASEKEIKEAQDRLITLYAYLCGECI